MNTTSALASTRTLYMGEQDAIAAIIERQKIVMPGATLQAWQLNQSPQLVAEAQASLNAALFQSAQLCYHYQLLPSRDVHILPFGNMFSVDVGIESWKRCADRFCNANRITWHAISIDMEDRELRQIRGGLYSPDDVGKVVYLWRSDKAQVYQMFGKEAATRGAGVWRIKAHKKGSGDRITWEQDQIPAHRSRVDVAERRALKMALMKEFSLDSLLLEVGSITLDPADYETYLEEAHVDAVEPDASDLEIMVEPEAEPQPAPSTVEIVIPSETQQLAELLGKECRENDSPKAPRASLRSWNYLVRLINEAVGQDGASAYVLSWLLQRPVNVADLPAQAMVSRLIGYLSPKMKKGQELIDNPKYDPTTVQAVIEAYNLAIPKGGGLDEDIPF